MHRPSGIGHQQWVHWAVSVPNLSGRGGSNTCSDAISAIESTEAPIPQQTATNTQIAPAGPPFVRTSVPVLPMWSMIVSSPMQQKEDLPEGERPCQTDDHGVADHRCDSEDTLCEISPCCEPLKAFEKDSHSTPAVSSSASCPGHLLPCLRWVAAHAGCASSARPLRG